MYTSLCTNKEREGKGERERGRERERDPQENCKENICEYWTYTNTQDGVSRDDLSMPRQH